MVRDANRVLRGSAAPRSFGAPKKWNAAAAAVEANSRRAQKSGEDNASLDGDGTRNEEEEHAKRPAKEKCNHPEEARTDERWELLVPPMLMPGPSKQMPFCQENARPNFNSDTGDSPC